MTKAMWLLTILGTIHVASADAGMARMFALVGPAAVGDTPAAGLAR